MFPKTLTLALATGTLALAAPTPPAHGEFNVDFWGVMGAGGTSYIMHAVPQTSASSDAPVYLVATPEHTNSVPGTPGYFTGSGSVDLQLSVDLTDYQDPQFRGVYNVVVPDVGAAAGHVANVLGLQDGEDNGWQFEEEDTKITHMLLASAPENQFYLCDQDVNGQSEKVLSFGSPSADGTSPEGCIPAEIFQGTIRN